MLENPKISVISPSLNHERFLRDTIESILEQSYGNFEHIVIDGGSTDKTLDILRSYPHIRWISTNDTGILEAYRKGLTMARGKYIIQCCISDGFLDKNWFKRCVDILDFNDQLSLVWALPQYMTEEGELLRVSYSDFFDDCPPQKMDFLPFWLATGFWFPEGNYCVRKQIFDICFPRFTKEDPFYLNPALGFIYNFNTMGYLSYFIPIVVNYGRLHRKARNKRLYHLENPVQCKYFNYIWSYREKLFKGKVKHVFRDGLSNVCKEIGLKEIGLYRRKTLRYRIRRSRFMNISLNELQSKLVKKLIRKSSRGLLAGESFMRDQGA